MGATALGATLSVTGASTLSDTLSVASTTDVVGATQLGSSLSVTGLTNVVGATQLGNTLSVAGTADVVGATALGATLSVTGETILGSNLMVAGTADVVGATKLGSTLSVTGLMNVVGATQLGNTLSVAGAADVVGATALGATLSVTGASTLGNTLSVALTADVVGATKLGATLSVTGASTLGNTLSVAGTAELVGATALGATLSVAGATKVGGATVLGNTLSVSGDVTAKGNMFIDGPQLRIPAGLKTGRPSESNAHALIYYNQDYQAFEGLCKIGTTGVPSDDNVWMPLGGVIDHDGDSFIRAMDANFADTDTLSFHADDAVNPRMTIDASNLEYNVNHELASGSVKFNASLSVKGNANFEESMKVKSTLSVKGDMKIDSVLKVLGATALDSTLSVKLDAAFEKDVRQGNNTSIFQVAQHNDSTTYATKFNEASNVGAIIYDREQKTHLALQGIGENRGWMPLGGRLVDVDGDTSIKTESAPGADEDTLTFLAAGAVVATMEVDKVNINQALSVGAVANFEQNVNVNANSILDGTLSVSGTTKINGELTTNNNVTLNGTAANLMTVKGSSSFEQNVTIAAGKSLYADTLLTETMGHYSMYNAGGEGRATGMLDMFYENVTIHGDLDIMGQINQSATNVTELYVEDKSILLGASSSSEVRSNADGSISYEGSNYTTSEQSVHEAGVKISGVPAKFPDGADKEAAAQNVMYEKSLLWNIPGENNLGGTSNLALSSGDDSQKHMEPFWEFKGGQVRITSHTQNDSKEYVSFVFRINSKEQLELVKLTSTVADPVDSELSFKTIAKFGNVRVA